MNKLRKPSFPKRAVVTAGMPYGEKKLHFGHVFGCHIHADIYARFLCDRIGSENVIFVSGTDCYGAGPMLKYEAAKREGFTGSNEDFVREFYQSQKAEFEECGVQHSLYGASGLDDSGRVHAELSAWLFNSLHKHGFLRILENMQFFDEDSGQVLNGRQVEGRCPISGCKSERAYADECSLGHQFSPQDLIAPTCVTTGKRPGLRSVKNWYFDLERFGDSLAKWNVTLQEKLIARTLLLKNVGDFLKPPEVYVRAESDELTAARMVMPPHEFTFNDKTKSATLVFKTLKCREAACALLREHGLRFRTGTTLVPFRLSGNVPWGIPVPEADSLAGQTFWCWPESLWAPLSFTQAYLEQTGRTGSWEDWWLNPDAAQYQFIGEDNIYFYAVAGIGLFMAMNEMSGRKRDCGLPHIVPNKHLLYMGKKASSSSADKPPGAAEFLQYYTQDQLRMHFAHMALGHTSGSFIPKAAMKDAAGFDATLAEGNILTNVFNRIVRSCFYSLQKYFDSALHDYTPSDEAVAAANELIDEYEWAMYTFEISRVIDLLDVYLRDVSRDWSTRTKSADVLGRQGYSDEVSKIRRSVLCDTFHCVRVAATLLHPFAPSGTARIAEYLCVGDDLWDWTHIRKPLGYFLHEGHTFKFLEPRVDFFEKHPSQIKQEGA